MGHCLGSALDCVARAPLAPGQLRGGRSCGLLKLELTLTLPSREALLAEMGVAMREDGGTLGVFSPKKVGAGPCFVGPGLNRPAPPAAFEGSYSSRSGSTAGGPGTEGPHPPQTGPPCVRPSPPPEGGASL